VLHYCVTNMPGAVPRTSTLALTNATMPIALQIANKGWQRAAAENRAILAGLNVVNGHVTHPKVAAALGLTYTDPTTLLS
jgi:alanine dehydrogenase